MSAMDPLIVYFSSTSGNTHRFVTMLGMRTQRIPLSAKVELPPPNEPYVLVCPTYADDDGSKAVPKQVIKFLNNSENRKDLCGVIGGGNRNFGELFAYAANIIARKCNVPCLYKFELSGTPRDVITVRKGIDKLWQSMKIKNQQQILRTAS